VAVVVASSPAIGIAPDRRAAVLARVERMEREGLLAILNRSTAPTRPSCAVMLSALARFARGGSATILQASALIYRILADMDLQPGLIGTKLVSRLRQKGHEVVAASPKFGRQYHHG
jgi:hypothetical protein